MVNIIHLPANSPVEVTNDSGTWARGNTVFAKNTAMNAATATKIDFPELTGNVLIRHITDDIIVWIGEDEDITAGATNVFPLEKGDALIVQMYKGNGNNLYGIASSGTPAVYAAGVANG